MEGIGPTVDDAAPFSMQNSSKTLENLYKKSIFFIKNQSSLLVKRIPSC